MSATLKNGDEPVKMLGPEGDPVTLVGQFGDGLETAEVTDEKGLFTGWIFVTVSGAEKLRDLAGHLRGGKSGRCRTQPCGAGSRKHHGQPPP